ncbi:MAG: hypothetical protein IKQ06_00965 [Bacilli bacterium]|nr:hypothetical protein [Bacilli bacterium]
MKKNYRYAIFLLVIIVVLFFCSIGIITLFQDKKIEIEKVNETDVAFVSDANSIVINNIISVSDQFGKSITESNNGDFGYLEFEVVNNTNEIRNYQIFITRLFSDYKEINPSYVSFYLTDDNNKVMKGFDTNKCPSYEDFNFIDNKADSKLIYKDSLKGNERKKYKLRVWLTENYVVDHSIEEQFAFNIGARAY